MAVFSRRWMSRLTFQKVFCLQTTLSDLKLIGVFTSKIITFHFGNLRRAHARINQFQFFGRRRRWSHVRPTSFHYCVYAVGFHLTEEPISTKAAIDHN